MTLIIKNARIERLAAEVSRMAGETTTDAIRRALEERKARLALGSDYADRLKNLRKCLEREIWPQMPRRTRGKRVSKRERERILGIGPGGFTEPTSKAPGR